MMARDEKRAQGFAQCHEILKKHGKTFYIMAKLLGPRRGRAIAAVYGFARTADDTVDEAKPGTTAPEIESQLAVMKEELRLGFEGRSEKPSFIALGETLKDYSIPLFPFDDMVAGVSMDLHRNRYQTFQELELYCYRVAGTVGLMITPIAGYDGTAKKTAPSSSPLFEMSSMDTALQHAKTLGTAFQLTNILRDVGEDLRRGRIYLPLDELSQFSVTESELMNGKQLLAESADFKFRFTRLMEYQIARNFALYREGLALIPLVRTLGGRIAFQFAVDAYSGILYKIRENQYDVFSKRAHLTFFQKFLMIPRSFFRALCARESTCKRSVSCKKN